MHLQPARVAARQAAVEAARQAGLGLGARELPLERLGERPAGAEDERLERALGHVHDLRDLGVRATLELAHDESRALAGRQMLKRAQDVRCGLLAALGCRFDQGLVELDLQRLAFGRPEVSAHLVVSDRQQPVLGFPRLRPLRDRAVCVEERLLGDVLGVRMVPDHGARIAVHGGSVATVELVERGRARLAEQRSHPCLYARSRR